MKKDNKLTFSAFEAVTGYSTQQLSNYKKKENQDLFRFVEEEGESFVLCTNAELREFQKRKGANTIQAEAEKTAESLELFQNSLNLLVERFQEDIKRETKRAEEMQLQAMQSINNAVKKMQIDNTNISNISTSFFKSVEDLGNISAKITEQHSRYQSYLKDLDTKYSNTHNLIASAVDSAKAIGDTNSQLIQTVKAYNNTVSQNANKISELTKEIHNTLQSVTNLRQKLEAEKKENYFKKYLLPIIIPSVIVIILLVINVFSYNKILNNENLLNDKIFNMNIDIDNIKTKKR